MSRSRHLGIVSCQPLQAYRQLSCWTMQHVEFLLHLWACAKDKKGCPSNISNKRKSNMLKKKKGKMLHFILLKNFNEYWKLLLKTAENAGNYCWKMLNDLLKKNYWNCWKNAKTTVTTKLLTTKPKIACLRSYWTKEDYLISFVNMLS